MTKRLAGILLALAAVYPSAVLVYLFRPDWLPGLLRDLGFAWRALLLLVFVGLPLAVVVFPPATQRARRALAVFMARLRADRVHYRELLTQLESYPNPNVHLRLGLYYQEQLQHAQAIEHLEKALEMDPMLLSARYRLAVSYLELGRSEDALRELQRVVGTERNHAFGEAMLRLGEALERVERFDEALEWYRQFYEYSGGRPEGCIRYGRLLERLGQPTRARELYREAIDHAAAAPDFIQRNDREWVRIAASRLRLLGRE